MSLLGLRDRSLIAQLVYKLLQFVPLALDLLHFFLRYLFVQLQFGMRF